MSRKSDKKMKIRYQMRRAHTRRLLSGCTIVAALAASRAVAVQPGVHELTLPQPLQVATAACAPVPATAPSRPLDLRRTFHEDFRHIDANSLAGDSARGWRGYFPYAAPDQFGAHTLPSTHEREIYVYPSYRGSALEPLGLNPLLYRRGGLEIHAARVPARLRNWLYNYPYYSGLLQSHDLFSQRYGYFEIRARMPRGHSMWPAFWLLDFHKAWPPEIDVLEMMDGRHPDIITQTTHWKDPVNGQHRMSWCRIDVPQADARMHRYGVLWTPSRITYYVDRKPTFTLATPAGLDQPMYMLIDLAVENNVDPSSPVDASFVLGGVSVWAY